MVNRERHVVGGFLLLWISSKSLEVQHSDVRKLAYPHFFHCFGSSFAFLASIRVWKSLFFEKIINAIFQFL